MSKKGIRFIVLLLIILIIVFCSHLYALQYKDLPLFDNKIILSYILNYVAAVVIFIVLERFIKKESTQVGFIFMAGSGLKFLLFFLLFYPSYKADGNMSTLEFISFFIPYAICLILEVSYLSKELDNQVFSSKKPE